MCVKTCHCVYRHRMGLLPQGASCPSLPLMCIFLLKEQTTLNQSIARLDRLESQASLLDSRGERPLGTACGLN